MGKIHAGRWPKKEMQVSKLTGPPCSFCEKPLKKMASGQFRCDNWECARYLTPALQKQKDWS